jgi:hypothetical protein
MPKTMFMRPKFVEAAEQISIESIPDAQSSVMWLSQEWRDAETRAKRRRLIRFANLARNRALVMIKRANISTREKMELRGVAAVYKRWLRSHRLKG